MCYLIKEQGHSYKSAREYVEKCRNIIYPNASFVSQLKRWEKVVNGLKIGLKKDDNFAKTNNGDIDYQDLYIKCYIYSK